MVITITTVNGPRDRNEEDRIKITTIVIPTQSRHLQHLHNTTRMRLHQMMRASSDHQKIYKWRIERNPGQLRHQAIKVILQLRTPNSALHSSPNLLHQLQLKPLQISILRQSLLQPGLQIIAHPHNQEKTFRIEDLLSTTVKNPSHKIENTPTTAHKLKILPIVLAQDPLQRRNSSPNPSPARKYPLNSHPPNQSTTASPAMNPSSAQAHTAKSSRQSISTRGTKSR